MIKKRVLILTSAICIGGAVHAKSLEENVAFCEECHGKDGISQETDIPTIAGFSAFAITDSLLFYKDGTRSAISSKFRTGDTSRPETDMNEIAEQLSEEEIEELAEYYSGKPFVPAKQPFDAEKAAIGAKIHDVHCTKCHEDGGSSKYDDVGFLAGQWTPYLRTAMKNFLSEKRTTEPKMLKAIKTLNEDEIEALLNYWASQQ